VLLNQIKAGAYERSLAEGKSHNFPEVLPEYMAEQAEGKLLLLVLAQNINDYILFSICELIQE